MATRRRKRAEVTPPGKDGDERTTLLAFLDYVRESVARKAEGVPEPQGREAGVPLGTSLLGLITHLAAVERFCFLGEEVDDLDATMRPAPDVTRDEAVADYRQAVPDANVVILACDDLGQTSPRPRRGRFTPSMRWTLIHMIEETARHAGHADILREQIDGATGR